MGADIHQAGSEVTCRHYQSSTLSTRMEGADNAVVRDFRYLIYRRRQCDDCGQRFRTFEMTEAMVKILRGEP